MRFPIDKDIPLKEKVYPASHNAIFTKAQFRPMKVGDSFLIPSELVRSHELTRDKKISSAIGAMNKAFGFPFRKHSYRTLREGIRVWRTK